MKTKNIFSMAVLIAITLMISSCEKEERQKMSEETGKAKIAILNLVTPNRPSSTVSSSGLQGYYLFMDNFQIYTQSLIPNKTTGYFLANPGSRTFRFDSTEIKANAILPSAAVGTSTIQAEAGKYYSVYCAGKVQQPEIVVTSDDLSRPPAGKAKVRVIHLSPDAGTLDLAGAFTTATTPLTTIFSNLTYKAQPVFTQMDAGFYKMELREKPTNAVLSTFTQNNQVIPTFIPGGSVQASFSMNFESGMVYTLVIRGYKTPAIAVVGQLANPLSVGAVINAYY